MRIPEFTPSAAQTAAARQLCRRLDPLMTVAGFQAGQVGFSGDGVGVVFCAAYADFRARFPRLAPDIEDAGSGACTDLNVEVVGRDEPRLARADLDGHGVDELLRDVGRDDLAPQAATLGRHPLADDLERLHGLLLEVFGRGASAAARADWT